MRDRVLTFHFWRRLTQVAVLLFLVAVPVLNHYRVHVFHGNLLAFNFAGIPFTDPLAALQVLAGHFSHTDMMLMGAGLVLLLALVMGRVFCGWLCPFGLLSELAHPKGQGKAARFFPFWSRALLVLAGLAAVVVAAPGPVLNQLSMPGWISRALQHAVLYREFLPGVLAAAVLLLLEAAGKTRLWCRWLCPQSVLLSLASVVLPRSLQVGFSPGRCTCKASDRPCLPACSLGLNPRKPGLRQRLECTNCGDCADACRRRGGALALGFGRGDAQKKNAPGSGGTISQEAEPDVK